MQEGGRLVDVDRHGSLASWISHRLIKVLQPEATPYRQTHTLFSPMTKMKYRTCGEKVLMLRTGKKKAAVPLLQK